MDNKDDILARLEEQLVNNKQSIADLAKEDEFHPHLEELYQQQLKLKKAVNLVADADALKEDYVFQKPRRPFVWWKPALLAFSLLFLAVVMAIVWHDINL